MFRGDTFVFDVQVFQANGAPADISGWTAWFTAKFYVNDPDLRAVMRQDNGDLGGIVLTQPTIGKLEVTVAPIATRGFPDGAVELVYDVQVRDNSGRVSTVDSGTLTVNPDVTRTF